jgi:hypothetical protein
MNAKTRRIQKYAILKRLKKDLGNYSKRKSQLLQFVKKLSLSRKKKNTYL